MSRDRRAVVLAVALLTALPGAASAAPGWFASVLDPSGDARGVSVGRSGLAEVLVEKDGIRDVDPTLSNLSFRPTGGVWSFAGSSGLPAALVDVRAQAIGNGTGDLVAWGVTVGPGPSRLILAVRNSGRWSAVEEVAGGVTPGTGALGTTADPSVAFNGAGEVLVSWLQARVVRARIRRASGGYGPAVALSAPGVTRTPAVAFADSGDAVAVWLRRGRVGGAHRRSGGSWVVRRAVSAGRADAVSPPVVAIDALGNAMVVWIAGPSPADTSGRRVEAAERVGTSGWGRRASLSPPTSLLAVDVAVDPAGDAIVVFGGVAARPARVRTRRAGGRWTGPDVLPGVCCFPQVAVSPLGDAFVAGTRPTFEEDFRVLRRAAGAARWTPAPDRVGRDAPNAPRLAVGPAGDAVLGWRGVGASAAVHSAAYEAARPPTLRALGGRPFRGQAGSFRLRIATSAPGRVLVTVRPMLSRRVVGAFVATVRSRAALVALPTRLVAVLRPGGYEITGDSGGRVIRRAFLRVVR